MNTIDYYDNDEEPPRPLGPLSRLPAMKEALPALLCFLIFILISMMHWYSSLIELLGASSHAVYSRGEYWRLLTTMFIHADIIHLLSNAFLFLIFGWLLKAYFGTMVFPISSFIIGIATTAMTIATYEPPILLIGASGMIYGMAALWIFFYIRFDYDHTYQVRIIRAIGFAMVMLLPTTFNPSTSYRSHAIGFINGIIAGFLLLPAVRRRIATLQNRDEPDHRNNNHRLTDW